MERYVDMASPLTGGKVKEINTVETHEFRKEKYSVHVRYYICEDTGERFTTTDQDTLLFNDLYSQYRIRHGIPFPDEIQAVRERYSLTCSCISKIDDDFFKFSAICPDFFTKFTRDCSFSQDIRAV